MNRNDNSTTIAAGLVALVHEAHTTALTKGWHSTWPDGRAKVHDEAARAPERLALIHSEVSEALEVYRDHGVFRRCEPCGGFGDVGGEGWAKQCQACGGAGFVTWWLDPVTGKPEGYVAELVDVLIRVADHIGALGVTPAAVQAILAKLAYNETRPVRHGGKKC